MTVQTVALALFTASGVGFVQEGAPSADEGSMFLAELEKRVQDHPFLGRVRFDRIDRPPFALYLQRPRGPAEDGGSFEDEILPWLVELERSFRDEYVEPLPLKPNGGLPVLPIAILSSRAAYALFAEEVADLDPDHAHAHFDPKLRLVVTSHESVGGEDYAEHRRAALHELVHALTDAHFVAPGRRPEVLWLDEGLAQFLSFSVGEPLDLRERHVDTSALRTILEIQTEGASDVSLQPLEQLLRVQSYDDLFREARRRAQALGIAADSHRTLAGFGAQSYLWMHFFHHADHGVHRASIGTYVQLVLGGMESSLAFSMAFPDVDLAGLDSGFEAYVRDRASEAGVTVIAPVAPSTVPAISAPTPVDESLAPEPDALTRLGNALLLVLAGELETALAELSGLEQSDAGPEFAARLATERARLNTWTALRDRYVADLVRTGASLSIEIGGKKVSGKVAALEEGFLVLASSRRPDERVPLAALDPLELVQMIGSGHESDSDWIRIYAYALAGNAKWKKILTKDKSPEAEALRDDAAGFYPETLRLARAFQDLRELEGLGSPDDVAGATSRMEIVHRLLPAGNDLGLIAGRKKALSKYATACLALLFEARSAIESLHAKVESIDGSRVRVVYDFEDAAQASDWIRDDEYLVEQREAMGPLSPPRAGTFGPGSGKFAGHGQVAWRWSLGLEAPFVVRYRVRWKNEPGVARDQAVFAVVTCADRFGNYVYCGDLGTMVAFDERARHSEQAVGRETMFLDRFYDCELRHQGRTLEFHVDGNKVSTIATGPRTTGNVYLWVHSNISIEVEELEMEGWISADSLAEKEREWIALQLAGLGLE